MINTTNSRTLTRYLTAWAVHAFTASAACIAVLTLIKIYEHEFIQAFWLMALTIVIDSIDGTLARLVKVKSILPGIDGALLDNLVDFLNYVITPCFFVYVQGTMLPSQAMISILMAIVLTSAYQFCQADAKTPDHFFKGFPCYWNIVIFYMFIFQTNIYSNAIILALLCLLIFVPIKYVYPSRLDYLTSSFSLKILMHILSVVFGMATVISLWTYPNINNFWLTVSASYIALYVTLSFYRTFYPLAPNETYKKNNRIVISKD